MVDPREAWPAAVSALVADVVSGDERTATVLAAFPTALYLHTGGHTDVVPVLTTDALRLPTGLCLTRRSNEVDWGVRPGDRVLVGGGRIALPDAVVSTARVWRPARVRAVQSPARPPAADRLPAAGVLGDRCAGLVAAALAAEPVDARVAGLVGAGPGLTPSGDDALCGILLTLRALLPPPPAMPPTSIPATSSRPPAAGGRVSEAVRRLTHRTTSLSASLLLAATDGYGLPQVVRLLDLLAETSDEHESPRGSPLGARAASSTSDVPAAIEQVLAIGHRSGADLLAGVRGTVEALTAYSSSMVSMVSMTRPTPQLEGARRG